MMKIKFQTMILAFIIFVHGFVGISTFAAAEDGWSIRYYGDAATADRTVYFAEFSESYKFSGDRALFIKYNVSAASYNEQNYIEVKNPLTSKMQTGKYTLTFYNKGATSPTTKISIGDQMIYTFADFTKKAAIAPSGESSWTEYSITFDYVAQDVDFLSFRFYSTTASEAIDNVSIVKENTSTNLVCDPSFEDFVEEIPKDEYDTTDYQPKCFFLSPGNGELILTWRNPAATELKSVKVYDITDGKEVLVTGSISKTPSAIVWHRINGLINGNYYQYKIVFSFNTKPDSIYFLGGSPSENWSYSIGTWNVTLVNSGPAGFCPAEWVLDHTTTHSGKSSLRFTTNIDRDKVDNFKSNIYIRADRGINMTVGKKYRISYWTKSQDVQRAVQMHMNWEPFDDQELSFSDLKGTSDWNYREYVYTCNSQKTLVILMDGMCEGIWFDDLACYELDNEGNPTGNNLIADGDFEALATTAVEKPTSVKGVGTPGGVKLSWNIPSKNYNGMKIYQKIFDKYEYRGTIAANVSELNINNLEMAEEYSYKLIPQNAAQYEGTEIELNIVTLLPDYEISKPTLYKGSTAVTALSGAGSYAVSVPVRNNTYEDGFNYEQIVAVYQGNTLVKLYSDKQSVAKKGKNATFTKTNTEFTIPDGEGYSVRLYIFDSRTNLNLLYSPVCYP